MVLTGEDPDGDGVRHMFCCNTAFAAVVIYLMTAGVGAVVLNDGDLRVGLD